VLSQPVVPLATSALALLLLVMVLLSVPGPIKTLYWFQVPATNGDIMSKLRGGVNGWCWSQVGVRP
jgi:hypothetical protein